MFYFYANNFFCYYIVIANLMIYALCLCWWNNRYCLFDFVRFIETLDLMFWI